MARRLLTNERIAEALNAVGGDVEFAALRLRVRKSVLRERIQQSPKLAAARQQAVANDRESGGFSLMKAIERGEPWAIMFILTRYGKDRGYGR